MGRCWKDKRRAMPVVLRLKKKYSTPKQKDKMRKKGSRDGKTGGKSGGVKREGEEGEGKSVEVREGRREGAKEGKRGDKKERKTGAIRSIIRKVRSKRHFYRLYALQQHARGLLGRADKNEGEGCFSGQVSWMTAVWWWWALVLSWW